MRLILFEKIGVMALLVSLMLSSACSNQVQTVNSEATNTDSERSIYYLKPQSVPSNGVYIEDSLGTRFEDKVNAKNSYMLTSLPAINSDNIKFITIDTDELNDTNFVQILIGFTEEGLKELDELSKENIGKDLFFVFNEKVIFHAKMIMENDTGYIMTEMKREVFDRMLKDKELN